MADIVYSLETLSGKHGGLLEVVESIVADGSLILILTDQDVMERRDAPLKGVFSKDRQRSFSIKGQKSPLVDLSPTSLPLLVSLGDSRRTNTRKSAEIRKLLLDQRMRREFLRANQVQSLGYLATEFRR